MTAKILTFPAPRDYLKDIPDGDLLAALGINVNEIPRQGDVDHVANYRAKRAALNRAALRVV